MTDSPLDALTINRLASVARTPLGEGSWVDLVSGFVRNAHDVMSAMHSATVWQQNETLRYDRYVPERRLSAGLRSQSQPLLHQTGMHLRATYGQPMEGVAAILYRTGEDFQGLHSDREMRWLDDTLVAIVVLGERRPFVVRERGRWADSLVDRVPSGQATDDLVLMPGEGDLLVMGGRCQADWMHGVPANETKNPRISLTWRWARRAGRPDTNPGYADGRQFSGRPRQPGTRTRNS